MTPHYQSLQEAPHQNHIDQSQVPVLQRQYTRKPKIVSTLSESPGSSSPESSDEKIRFDPEKLKNIKKEKIEKLQQEASNIEITNRNEKYDKLIKKIGK